MEPDVELTCSVCEKPFLRVAKEHRRNVKRRRKVYCGFVCSGKAKTHLAAWRNDPAHIEQHLKPNWGRPARARDEFSPFRYFIAKARSTARKLLYGDTDLTTEYLKSVWESQRGQCPYTGLQMDIATTTQGRHIKAKSPRHASLDRIDSDKGYVQGNVEFVCLGVNLAKAAFPRQIALDFFAQVRDTKPTVL